MRWFLLALALAMGAAQSQEPAPSPTKGAEGSKTQAAKGKQKAAQDQRGTTNAPLVVDILRPKKSEAEAAKDAKDSEDKATEARFSFWFNFLLVLFNGILAVSTVLLWFVTNRAANVANEAANAAKKSADTSLLALRPWLFCKVEIAGPLTFNAEKDAIFRLQFTIKNVGKTPAMNVANFFPQFNLFAPGYEHSILKLQRLAENSRGLPVGSVTGVILFPDEEHIEHIQYPIRRDELEKACEDLPPPKHYWPELIVLITYTYQLAAIRADTGLICQISKNDGKPLLLDEGLSKDEMRISLHRMWGGFAT